MKHESALERHGLFDAKVPRFTSYPPANWFDRSVTDQTLRGWRARIGPDDPLSLYVHVPFCKRLCWFCACRTQGSTSEAPLTAYVDRLLTEVAATRAEIGSPARTTRLHLGGGTPTILSARLLDRLLAGLDRAFDLGQLDEFSVEIDPTDVGPRRLAALRGWGMTRASLGIQDFAPKVQEAIGRQQSAAQTGNVVGQLRDLGIGSLNFDLLYGLPFQTRDSLLATLRTALELDPDRIALFGYAHVPWMSKRQIMIPSDALPAPKARYALFEAARRHLLGAGFVQVGIDHFARPGDGLARAQRDGRLMRNFQGYTDDPAQHLLGFGASAISHYPQGFSQNIAVTGAYGAAIDAGVAPAWRGYALDQNDLTMARFVADLLCYHRADVPVQAKDLRRKLGPVLKMFHDAIDWNGTEFAMKHWARPLVRIVTARIALETTGSAPQHRYSAAI